MAHLYLLLQYHNRRHLIEYSKMSAEENSPKAKLDNAGLTDSRVRKSQYYNSEATLTRQGRSKESSQ